VRSGVRVVGLVAAAALFTTGLQGAAMGATQSPSVTATSGAPTTPAPRRLVTGWLPYWSMGSANSVVQANAALFTDVSPFWYDFRGYSPTVNLVSEYGGVASSVALYHSLKIKVLPTITDGTGGGCSYEMYNQLSTASGRAYVINTIKLLVVANNFDGIDLDWEQFAFCNGSRSWPTMRTNWIAFVKGLAAGLHTSGRLLSITVPAGNATASDSTGYYLYAWHDIGPFIDRLRIMTYDYSPSTPGPIGPYPWIDQVAAYAVTQVAAGKIQIGVASYGRDWVWSRAGSCPSLAPAGASAAQAATFFNNISWASQTHEYDSSYAATYIKTLFTNVIATTPGVSLPVAPVSTWDNTNKERTFPYQVKFTGRNQPARVTTLAVGGLMGGTSVIVGSAANVFAGAKVSGSGIGVNATVAGVVGNVVTLSVNNAGTVTGTLTFTKHTGLTGVKGAAKTNTILAPSTAGISVGSTVTGTGIGVAATVKSISGITLTLSVENTADLLPASTITFTTVAKPAAVGGVAGSTDIVVSSVAGVVLNSAVSGAGVAAGSKVTAIDAVRHNLAVSVHNTAAVTGMISITPPPVNASCTISRVGWYSEAQSAIARATLVNKYHLGGIAEWTIGGEDPAQWAGLKSYAQAIAPWPSVVTVTGQSQLTPGATGALSGSVTFRGTALAGASLLVGRHFGRDRRGRPLRDRRSRPARELLVAGDGTGRRLGPDRGVGGRCHDGSDSRLHQRDGSSRPPARPGRRGRGDGAVLRCRATRGAHHTAGAACGFSDLDHSELGHHFRGRSGVDGVAGSECRLRLASHGARTRPDEARLTGYRHHRRRGCRGDPGKCRCDRRVPGSGLDPWHGDLQGRPRGGSPHRPGAFGGQHRLAHRRLPDDIGRGSVLFLDSGTGSQLRVAGRRADQPLHSARGSGFRGDSRKGRSFVQGTARGGRFRDEAGGRWCRCPGPVRLHGRAALVERVVLRHAGHRAGPCRRHLHAYCGAGLPGSVPLRRHLVSADRAAEPARLQQDSHGHSRLSPSSVRRRGSPVVASSMPRRGPGHSLSRVGPPGSLIRINEPGRCSDTAMLDGHLRVTIGALSTERDTSGCRPTMVLTGQAAGGCHETSDATVCHPRLHRAGSLRLRTRRCFFPAPAGQVSD
jgi:spore germination protein YaaH